MASSPSGLVLVSALVALGSLSESASDSALVWLSASALAALGSLADSASDSALVWLSDSASEASESLSA